MIFGISIVVTAFQITLRFACDWEKGFTIDRLYFKIELIFIGEVNCTYDSWIDYGVIVMPREMSYKLYKHVTQLLTICEGFSLLVLGQFGIATES